MGRTAWRLFRRRRRRRRWSIRLIWRRLFIGVVCGHGRGGVGSGLGAHCVFSGGDGAAPPSTTTASLLGDGIDYDDYLVCAIGPTPGTPNAGQSFGAFSAAFMNEIRFGTGSGADGVELAGPTDMDLPASASRFTTQATALCTQPLPFRAAPLAMPMAA